MPTTAATDVVDLDALRAIEDGVTQIEAQWEIQDLSRFLPTIDDIAAMDAPITAELGVSTGAVAAVGEVALPLVIGAKVETFLLNNQSWDTFWEGVGYRLDGVWNDVVGFLRGPAGVTFETMQLNINLASHITMRAVRQLYTRVLSRALTGLTNLARLVHGIQKEVQSLARAVQYIARTVGPAIQGAVISANRYTDAKVRQAENAAFHVAIAAAQSAESWAVQHLYYPLLSDVQAVDRKVDAVASSIPDIAHAQAALVAAAAVAPLAKELLSLRSQVSQLAQEAEDCTAPMCETIGPKTDWGKLFSRFKPALLFALLAAVAAEDPKEVERGAEEVASLLGPVLSVWMEGYLGITGQGSSSQPSQVTDTLGTNPFGL